MGDSGEPCGHPFVVLVNSPSITTPDFSALAINVTTRSSEMLLRISLRISPWGISSKKLFKSTAA
ncbi:MAG: hypothetical protein PHU24_10450, partial [Sphaerochaetaceae bacterium]|nr:hypothetical protein [Sphaerochaetaceae bacterium]MDD4763741.1 hypothetical protein [Sphaerochaetaceae bacterium]